MPLADDDLHQRLDALAKRRLKLKAEQATVAAELRDAIREAFRSGVGVTELAAATGMTRRAVYDALGHPRKRASAAATASPMTTHQED